jgi:DNA-binding transcriptional LysR family regulator
MDFDLRLLRHARALAEAGSFARAARALHLTQPTLSRSIQMLEQRVGVALFERSARGVQPTDLGRLFLAHAHDVLASAESLEREVALIRGAATGHLVIGAGTFVAPMFVERALARFVARHPGVGLRVVNANGADLLRQLRTGELDLYAGAVPDGADAGGLAIVPLATRTGRFLVRAGHPLAGRGTVPIDELLRWPLVGATRSNLQVTELLVGSRPRDGVRSAPDFSCESASMMRAVALASDHVLLVPLAMVADDVGAGRLVVLRTAGTPITQAFSVVRVQGRSTSAPAEALVAEIVEADRASRDAERRLEAALDRGAPAEEAAGPAVYSADSNIRA